MPKTKKTTKTPKIMKTIRFDKDIVEWAIKEAKKAALPYQTFINTKLKELMVLTKKRPLLAAIQKTVREELAKRRGSKQA